MSSDSRGQLNNTATTSNENGGSTSSSMYKMKPAFDLPATIELPHGMYRVSPVSIISGSNSLQSVTALSPSSSKKSLGSKADLIPQEKISVIEKRQIEILDKLNNLREIIVGIQEKFVSDEESAEKDSQLIENFVDIVVNANPSKPPFSLLFLHKLLRQYYGTSVKISNHLHSSVTGPLHEYLSIFSKLETRNESAPVLIKITLIWKNSEDVELMVNPINESLVFGEGNLARFLSRLIPNVFPLNYDALDWNTMSLVDGFIMQALNETTFNIQMVEGYLKGRKQSTDGPFLLGEISIADFITFSAVARELLKNVKAISLAKYPNVRNWMDCCQQYGEFELFGY